MNDQLTPDELFIYKALKQFPDSAYVSEDGTTLYLLEGEARDGRLLKIRCDGGKLFNVMTPEEINQVITEFLGALME